MTTQPKNEVQFQPHVFDRLAGRFNGIVSYGEIQTVLMSKPLRNGNNEVLISVLQQTVTISDPTAYNGHVRGNKIYALVRVHNQREVMVDTIALRP